MENEKSFEITEEYTADHSDRRLLGLLPMFILIIIIILRISWTLYKSFGQKTRSPQQRRGGMGYVGTRPRSSLGTHEPTIYVSPSNMPPPPKYECMAPPSYEEVVGIHYPNYQVQQPIAQPIATALVQSTSGITPHPQPNTRTNNTDISNNDEAVVVTVNERSTVTSS